MSAGSISLESAIRTCKVNTGYADRNESDRFLNSNLAVCPIWNGVDSTGRQVCPDSFYTKRAGCNSALDRVEVENYQRPQYSEYVSLTAQGIKKDLYQNTKNTIIEHTGNFGGDLVARIKTSCNYVN